MSTSLADKLKARRVTFRREIEVPELSDLNDGRPFSIWVDMWTLRDQEAVQDWIENNSPRGFAEILILKALDENGDRMFTRKDHLPLLMECIHSDLMESIATRIVRAPTMGEAEGNSEAIQS